MQATFSRFDIRTVIKFFCLLGKEPPEVHGSLVEALGAFAPSIQTVRKWVAAIKEGREDVQDEQRSGRPVSASNAENVEKTEQAVAVDRRRTCEDLAEDVGVSVGTMHHILTDVLQKTKVFSKWVPHLLSDKQKAARVQSSRENLRRSRSRREPDFLDRIVTGDETWVYSWDPELKRQSAEWRNAGSPRPQKAVRKQGSLKVMHIVFFDRRAIIVNWPVPNGQTVNGEYYLWFLREKLRPAIRKKRPELLQRGVILHHDNAPAHRKNEVINLLDDWDWEILQHPPYSPDLAPADFFLFPKLKENMRGTRFEDSDAINLMFQQQVRDLDRAGIGGWVDAWVHRWQKCVAVGGDYVE